MENVVWKVKGFYKANAQKVYDEIQTLGTSYSAEDIVELARGENTELHKCFTWDVEKAAYKQWVSEARIISASLVTITTTTEGEPVAVRVISRTENYKEYAPTSIVVRSEPAYADLLHRALAELEAFKRKYKTISELQEIFDAIDEIAKTEP